MKKTILSTLLLVVFFSCQKKEAQPIQSKEEKTSCSDTLKKKEGFEMYQMSEMAMLMEQMYADNERLKQRIITGDTIGKFPQHFLKIHNIFF